MIRKTVPFGRVVPTLRWPSSAAPSLLAGNPSVVQMLQASAPGRPLTTFLATSSILTMARPVASCPVITRRTFNAMVPSLVATRRAPIWARDRHRQPDDHHRECREAQSATWRPPRPRYCSCSRARRASTVSLLNGYTAGTGRDTPGTEAQDDGRRRPEERAG